MSMNWKSYKTQTKAAANNAGKFIFVSGKTTRENPLLVRPVGDDVQRWEMVYDPETKRNRRPRLGEKPQVRIAFNALCADGKIHIVIAPKSVADGYEAVCDVLERYEVAVAISSSGSGMQTEYSVARHRGDFPATWDAADLYDLSLAYGELVGGEKPDLRECEPTPAGQIGDELRAAVAETHTQLGANKAA